MPVSVQGFFCDDVRLEEGGKFSLMGIYGPELIATAVGIPVLAKLCLFVRMRFEKELPIKEALLEVQGPDGKKRERIKMNFPQPDPAAKKPDNYDLTAFFAMGGVEITEDNMTIEARVTIGKKTFDAGRLKIVRKQIMPTEEKRGK